LGSQLKQESLVKAFFVGYRTWQHIFARGEANRQIYTDTEV